MSSIGGSRWPAASCAGVTRPLSARLAARNIPSVTFGALATRAPRPTPGKM